MMVMAPATPQDSTAFLKKSDFLLFFIVSLLFFSHLCSPSRLLAVPLLVAWLQHERPQKSAMAQFR
jgi:hypothetical protein